MGVIEISCQITSYSTSYKIFSRSVKREELKKRRELKRKLRLKKLNMKLNEIEKQKESEYTDLNETVNNQQDEESVCISTILTDKSLIDRILSENYLGFTSKEELEKFQNKGEIVISKSDDECYDFIFKGDYNEKEALSYVDSIIDEYATLVQESTYLKLLEKIEKENLSLESEIVDDEDSIVLTLNIS